MSDTPNVFISWSGRRSKQAAETLRDWVQNVIQAARPFMSQLGALRVKGAFG